MQKIVLEAESMSGDISKQETSMGGELSLCHISTIIL